MPLVAVLAVLLSAPRANIPHLRLEKGFKPNPQFLTVRRAENGSLPMEAVVVKCDEASPGLRISRNPVGILDIKGEFENLQVLGSNNDRIVARAGDGTTVCGTMQLTLRAAPGSIELFVIAQEKLPDDAEGKVRVFDADRPRYLEDSVRTMAAAPAAPLVIKGELSLSPEVPDVQLDTPKALTGLKWKLTGAAAEVTVSSLLTPTFEPPVKAGETLTAGRWAIWVRGTSADARGAYTVVAVPGTATVKPLQLFSTPTADTPLESRLLSSYLPGLTSSSQLMGPSKEATALRQRAFLELPPELLVFRQADDEVLLALDSAPEGKLTLLATDGTTLEHGPAELALKPGGNTVKVARGERLSLAALADPKDPRVKALAKQRGAAQACLEKQSDEAKCKTAAVMKAEAKLEADLKKAFAKKHAAELTAIERRVKSLVARAP
ncbi:MAG: hypothetical protein IPJ65_38575 [Archangiaceae bacterium]|nr:hypothetical protein [Archangiaceae bacterium]